MDVASAAAVRSGVDRDLGQSRGAPRSLAVGVLALAPGVGEADRWEARLEVALRAYKYGYFLLDVIEVGCRLGDPAYLVVEELATRTDADAFVVQGAVDLGFLREVADRVRMRIRLPPPHARSVR